jgi:hypothetical protein
MNVAFLTEATYKGKWPATMPNARTEIAWQCTLNADHFNIYDYDAVKGYDAVFIIFPKGTVNLNAVGSQLIDTPNSDSKIFASPIVSVLKESNKKVCFVQEGPCWLFNDYTLVDQFNYYNQLQQCDILFAHNESDEPWYSGLFPEKEVYTMPTLMIEDTIRDIQWQPKNMVMIAGNMSRWYGGFQSYMVAGEMGADMWVPTSHSSREGENQMPGLRVLPRVSWLDWIRVLSNFKYAVNMMPTVAAGTFSLNCAYFGIPCIANEKLDTQRICFPQLAVDVHDVSSAKWLARKLVNDTAFYESCSKYARRAYSEHYNKEKFLTHIHEALSPLP